VGVGFGGFLLSRPFSLFLFFYLLIIIYLFLIKQNETVRFNLPPLKEIRPRIYTTNLDFEISVDTLYA
jgi:hypothetical protein